ncbi:hypothetical protein J8J27_26810, partial [Mycobacterium tuberculosis]|nr:hypothetical protein [Mycobacterium tuberculosis]
LEHGHAAILDRLEALRAAPSGGAAVAALRDEIAALRSGLDERSLSAGLNGLDNRLVALGRRVDQLVAGRGEAFAAMDEIRAAIAERPAVDW